MNRNQIKEISHFLATPIGEWILKKAVRRNSKYYNFVRNKKIKTNTFLLESYHAVNTTGNVYAIFKKLLEENPSGRYYWVVTDLNNPMIPYLTDQSKNVSIVLYESRKYYKLLASCEYLINDTSFMPYFIKKEQQIYINTWHGTPLKTLGLDIKDADIHAHKNIQRNLLQTDILLMPNEFTAEKLLKSHDLDGIYKGDVYITGNARVDNTFSDSTEVREKYSLPKDKKIILYAPTWKKAIEDTTNKDIESLIGEVKKIQDSVPQEYVVLLKAHYFIYQKFVELNHADKVVPNWVDTNELLAAVDKLITDYSSIFFDFLPLKKPIYFFIPDKDSYEKKRGFYLDLNSLPGLVTTNLDEITENLNINEDVYISIYKKNITHYLENFCLEDTGNSSKKITDIILSKTNSDIKHISYDSGKKTIVMYGGGFFNNGITNSLINLSHILDYSKYELIILESERIFPEKIKNLKKIDRRAKIVYKFSYSFRTLFSTYNRNLYYRQGYHSKLLSKKYLVQDMNMEFKRIFGKLIPDIAVDFGGYNKEFNALIALSNSRKKSVFLHNIMLKEFNKMNGYKYIHKWNLKVIFSAYNLFDNIISVSESANIQNQRDLIDFGVDTKKMKFVNNTIDGEEILSKKEKYKIINDGNPIKSGIDGLLRLPYEETVNEFMVQNVTSILPPDTSKFTFVNVARLSPEKNHFNLINAFQKLLEKYPNSALYIVGDGPLSSDLLSYVRELNLENDIHFYGFLDNPIPIINMCGCFVLSSNYEGQGLALIEAMILKKAVIGTDVPGINSVLENYPESLVENTVASLTEGMERYIEGELKVITDFDYVNYNEEALRMFYDLIC